ncbi:uncharacterized protein HGUI_00402 [Hanseniaspora guilliermondii]|uniref:Uncharacterized protein n=1 Tax=Hanseniaspora guilliermondii TaxID=56406 RepID=A0A1L0AUF8_9ASCO|nr:uncharacterized protein HGUI_00402 [Hanseniaspora guilliermondii]
MNSVKNKSMTLRKTLCRFYCKQFSGIEEAKNQILSHPTVVKYIKNENIPLIENTKSLTECYHTFLNPLLKNLEEKEVLELQKYILERASSFEFGLSDLLMREIVNSRSYSPESNCISSSVFENLVKLNPGRRISHLEYLGELQRLNIDIMDKNSNIMMFAFDSIMESLKEANDADLVSKLTQLVYVFVNMPPEVLTKSLSLIKINEFIKMLIDSNSTRLLELALDKILEAGCSISLLEHIRTYNAEPMTPYQQLLILRFELLGSNDKMKESNASNYLEFVKKNGPYLVLSDGERLATETSESEEQLLYKEISLNRKLDIESNKNYFHDALNIFLNTSFGNAIKNNKGKSDFERILYLNNPTNFPSLKNDTGDEFEKVFRYYHSIINGRENYSLKEVQEQFLSIKNKDFSELEFLKIQQLHMLALSVIGSSDEAKDCIIELLNENVAKYLKTDMCLDFIKAFVVSILMTRDVDLANYIKEGFYNNGSITKSDIKELNKFFVNYGEFSESNKEITSDEFFKRNMQDLILDEIVNRI